MVLVGLVAQIVSEECRNRKNDNGSCNEIQWSKLLLDNISIQRHHLKFLGLNAKSVAETPNYYASFVVMFLDALEGPSGFPKALGPRC